MRNTPTKDENYVERNAKNNTDFALDYGDCWNCRLHNQSGVSALKSEPMLRMFQ
jgi:hypothetical protein